MCAREPPLVPFSACVQGLYDHTLHVCASYVSAFARTAARWWLIPTPRDLGHPEGGSDQAQRQKFCPAAHAWRTLNGLATTDPRASLDCHDGLGPPLRGSSAVAIACVCSREGGLSKWDLDVSVRRWPRVLPPTVHSLIVRRMMACGPWSAAPDRWCAMPSCENQYCSQLNTEHNTYHTQGLPWHV